MIPLSSGFRFADWWRPVLQLTGLLLGPALLIGLVGVGAWGQGTEPPVRRERPVYADHPPLGHTGGLGEPTCHVCHFGGAVNEGGGTLAVEGLPDRAEAGETYELKVRLVADMKRSGFMLAIRRPDGTQAGTLAPLDTARVAVGSPDSTRVQYAHHTLEGTVLKETGRATWLIQWTAPAGGGVRSAAPDTTLVHVAANAANDDASEFGDDVYTNAEEVLIRGE